MAPPKFRGCGLTGKVTKHQKFCQIRPPPLNPLGFTWKCRGKPLTKKKPRPPPHRQPGNLRCNFYDHYFWLLPFNKAREEVKGTNYMGRMGFCEILWFRAVSCVNLRKAKISKRLRIWLRLSLLVCPFNPKNLLRLFLRNHLKRLKTTSKIKNKLKNCLFYLILQSLFGGFFSNSLRRKTFWG